MIGSTNIRIWLMWYLLKHDTRLHSLLKSVVAISQQDLCSIFTWALFCTSYNNLFVLNCHRFFCGTFLSDGLIQTIFSNFWIEIFNISPAPFFWLVQNGRPHKELAHSSLCYWGTLVTTPRQELALVVDNMTLAISFIWMTLILTWNYPLSFVILRGQIFLL